MARGRGGTRARRSRRSRRFGADGRDAVAGDAACGGRRCRVPRREPHFAWERRAVDPSTERAVTPGDSRSGRAQVGGRRRGGPWRRDGRRSRWRDRARRRRGWRRRGRRWRGRGRRWRGRPGRGRSPRCRVHRCGARRCRVHRFRVRWCGARWCWVRWCWVRWCWVRWWRGGLGRGRGWWWRRVDRWCRTARVLTLLRRWLTGCLLLARCVGPAAGRPRPTRCVDAAAGRPGPTRCVGAVAGRLLCCLVPRHVGADAGFRSCVGRSIARGVEDREGDDHHDQSGSHPPTVRRRAGSCRWPQTSAQAAPRVLTEPQALPSPNVAILVGALHRVNVARGERGDRPPGVSPDGTLALSDSADVDAVGDHRRLDAHARSVHLERRRLLRDHGRRGCRRE
jgi:hypothetical protein